jgi:hypothetical protein
MANIEEGAKAVLEKWGFVVHKIPVSTVNGVKTPDFQVNDEAAEYLVEVKERDDDPEQIEMRDQTLGAGQLYQQHTPLVRTNRVSGIIGYAAKQLKVHGDGKSSFKLVWLVAIGDNQEAKYMQFESALYGTTRMVDMNSNEGHRPCYFFGDSDFYRYRNTLDAAIISTSCEARLCLNPMSKSFAAFRETMLCKCFGSAVCNPLDEVAANYAYIVDADIDRRDENAVMDYMRAKHRAPRLININLGQHSATIASGI